VIVRENTQGMYSGIEHFVDREHSAAEAVSIITRAGSERVARFAFDYTRREKRRSLTIAHKANILKATSGLFLETCRLVAKEFPDVKVSELIIDNMCMQLVKDPTRFDVIVTTNLFGDILSDLVAGLVGGLGVVPGANIGYGCAIFEAVHGTAPDIAGKGIANPAASMMAAGQMLRHLEKRAEADRLEAALMKAMADPATRTADLGGRADTAGFTEAVLAAL
jgi:isocitrate dehydrogenase (NAD+)